MDTPGECLDSVRCRTGPVGALTAPQTSPSQRRCGRVLSCKQGHEPHDEEFKAADTSSTWQACKRIKSQTSFSQIQRCLFLVLFTQTSQHKQAHAGHVSHIVLPTLAAAGLEHGAKQLYLVLQCCLHLDSFRPQQQMEVGALQHCRDQTNTFWSVLS